MDTLKLYAHSMRMQMKSQLHFDKQQNSSEEGKTGRLFILFIKT